MNRIKTIQTRLNEKEVDLFKKEAERHQYLIIMIVQFDDLGTK
ncbi:hypothetical protein [Hoylesella buccalis]|nr:hypothetical protein [Hoylesella buccalis]